MPLVPPVSGAVANVPVGKAFMLKPSSVPLRKLRKSRSVPEFRISVNGEHSATPTPAKFSEFAGVPAIMLRLATKPTPNRKLCVPPPLRSEEHTSELQSRGHLVCRLLLEKQNTQPT